MRKPKIAKLPRLTQAELDARSASFRFSSKVQSALSMVCVQGRSVAEACKMAGISRAGYYLAQNKVAGVFRRSDRVRLVLDLDPERAALMQTRIEGTLAAWARETGRPVGSLRVDRMADRTTPADPQASAVESVFAGFDGLETEVTP